MTEIILPPNPAVKAADEVIHRLIMNVGVNAAIVAVDAEFPFLANPIISNIVRAALTYVAGYMEKALAQAAAFTVIDTQVSVEAANYQKALIALKAALASGDQNAIERAKVDFTSAVAHGIHFDGS